MEKDINENRNNKKMGAAALTSDRKDFKEIKHVNQPFPQKRGIDIDEMGLFCGGVSSL